MTEPSRRGGPRRAPHAALVALGLAIASLAAGLVLWPLIRRVPSLAGHSAVTQAVVVQRTRDVARLVTSETTLRDVLVYENRRLGSTKRALVVVTGRVLAGIDLGRDDGGRGVVVRVDDAARRIRVTLPRARVLGVEVTGLKTYDERSGLWNPFRPADRDSIFRLAREQLVITAGELAVTRRAEASARRLLESLLSTDGYTAEVGFTGGEASPPPATTPTSDGD